jgi:hypothetical protein
MISVWNSFLRRRNRFSSICHDIYYLLYWGDIAYDADGMLLGASIADHCKSDHEAIGVSEILLADEVLLAENDLDVLHAGILISITTRAPLSLHPLISQYDVTYATLTYQYHLLPSRPTTLEFYRMRQNNILLAWQIGSDLS